MSLLKDITRPEIRKLFGKKEVEIIEKQLLGIALKPSENTRLSRDIKKKFEAIKILSENKNEFNLKKGARINELIEEAKEVILEDKHLSKIRRIWLFGSTAENQRSFRSDIDLAVEFSKISQEEASDFRVKVLGRVNNLLDIQVFNFLPEKIKKEVSEKGKIIYEPQD